MTINMKQMKALQATAEAKFAAWAAAGTFTLQNHTGYSAALKANAAATDAALELRGFAHAAIIQIQSDPTTDPSWFPTVKKVWDRADYMVQTLANAKQAVLADLAAHIKVAFSPAEAASLASAPAPDAAAAVDAKTKAQNPNPNAQKPDAQSTSAPPVDVPPDAPSSPSWGLWAGLAAGGALLLKILKVW